jgi:hypothetical protein
MMLKSRTRCTIIAALLLAALALSACGGAVITPGAPQATATMPPRPTQEPPTMTLTPEPPSATPVPTERAATPTPVPATSVPPTRTANFSANPAPLPAGFPMLPDAQFVAYNPAYDPCLEGKRDCAPGRVTWQVWLYEVRLPALLMGPAAPHVLVGAQVAELLQKAGYQVESVTTQGLTTLSLTSPANSPIAYAEIEIGPRVSDLTPPPDYQFVGLRLSIELR